MERRTRQSCPLSLSLFTFLLADLKEEMRRRRWEGVKLGTKKVCTLAYAHDVAIMVENEGG